MCFSEANITGHSVCFHVMSNHINFNIINVAKLSIFENVTLGKSWILGPGSGGRTGDGIVSHGKYLGWNGQSWKVLGMEWSVMESTGDGMVSSLAQGHITLEKKYIAYP